MVVVFRLPGPNSDAIGDTVNHYRPFNFLHRRIPDILCQDQEIGHGQKRALQETPAPAVHGVNTLLHRNPFDMGKSHQLCPVFPHALSLLSACKKRGENLLESIRKRV